MQPTVSIIMPVYNRRHLIERALASVRQQTFPDWELLIIDDGSTDELVHLVLPLVDAEPRYRYLRHANRGVARTRNVGLHAAMGTFATFLDSDDEYKPDHLQTRLDYFESHPEVDVIHGGVELVGPEESHWVDDAFRPGERIHIKNCTIGSTFFGKRDAFLKAGGFKPLPYSAESEFLPRLESSCHVERVEFPTYIYYTGLDDSICSRVKKGEL